MSTGEEKSPVLDVRVEAGYKELHLAEAVNIPLEELPERIHELPPKTLPLTVFDTDHRRAESAQRLLTERGRVVPIVLTDPALLRTECTACGASHGRLWRPRRLLEEAVETARKRWGELQGRRALDLACGCGREAVYLASVGCVVDAWDLLPDAVARCEDLARRSGVRLHTRVCDLRYTNIAENGPYDLVMCFYYLHRPKIAEIAAAVRPGGFLVYETFVDPHPIVCGHPKRSSCVLRSGELRQMFSDWAIISYQEGLNELSRVSAALIASRPFQIAASAS